MRKKKHDSGADPRQSHISSALLDARKLKPTLLVISTGLLLLLFHLYGNSSYVENSGTSIFVWLFGMWTSNQQIDYSHGPLVLLFCAYLVYKTRKQIFDYDRETYVPAVFLLALALVLHLIGLRIQYASVCVSALILSIFSIFLFFLGKPSAKYLWFPCVFFLFATPWPLLGNASFPLRVFATKATEAILEGLAIPVLSRGTAIIVSSDPPLTLEVADPCSGLRSIMALSALTAGWAYLKKMPLIFKITFFASAVPIAIIANVFRITSVVLLSFILKRETALDFYHDFSGYLVFVTAVLLMSGQSALVDKYLSRQETQE